MTLIKTTQRPARALAFWLEHEAVVKAARDRLLAEAGLPPGFVFRPSLRVVNAEEPATGTLSYLLEVEVPIKGQVWLTPVRREGMRLVWEIPELGEVVGLGMDKGDGPERLLDLIREVFVSGGGTYSLDLSLG